MNKTKVSAAVLAFVGSAFCATTALADDIIYVATNKTQDNTISAFHQEKGQYMLLGEYKTGGKGTGDLEVPALQKDPAHPLANGDDPLISAYGITATKDGLFLLAVNAGDATVSLLKRNTDNSLTAVNTQPAGDKFPLSVAVSGNKVVVASVGEDNGKGSISAFLIEDGRLKSIQNSRRDLAARPSTIKFSSDGEHVVLSELVTGKIKTFAFSDNLSSEPTASIDSPREEESRFQAIPVGFDIKSTEDGDYILMSEARFLTPDFKLRSSSDEFKGSAQFPHFSWQTSSVSSYQLDDQGALKLVSGDVLTGENVEGDEIANCWVVLSKDGKYLWTANALSSSISLYEVGDKGKLSLMDAAAYKNNSEQLFFGDITISSDGKQLYQLVGNQGKVLIFDIDEDNTLSLQGEARGLPELGSYGLVALAENGA